MLAAAEPFISRNIHPTVIVRACYQALEYAMHVCEEIAVPISIDDREAMMNLLRSTIGTKFSSRFGDLIVSL
jgi:T-complex protein 1 subunit gamma